MKINMRRFRVIIFFLQFIIIPSTALWVVVEFLIYLFKDHPFNWWSFGIFITNFTAMAIFMMVDIGIYIKRKIKQQEERDVQIQEIRNSNKKSKFQQRLDEAIKSTENKLSFEELIKEKKNEKEKKI